MSVAEYADHLGVSVPMLYLWMRLLGSCAGPVAASAACRPKLVEVTLARSGDMTAQGMVLRLCAGRRSIEVPRGFDQVDLRRLVEAIESC